MLWRRLKSQRWGLAVTLLLMSLYGAIFVSAWSAQGAESDGVYVWAYSRSLVFDHDLDFNNDYALCGDPQGVTNFKFAGGRPMNTSFIGPAIFMAPVLWVVHLVPLPGGEPEAVKAGCRGPYVRVTLMTTVVLAALTMFLAYRVGRRFASDGVAAVAIGIFGLGSTIIAYASVYTSYTHVYEAFAAALVVLLSVRASESPRRWSRWLAAGIAVALALHMRPNCALLVCVPATLAVVAFWGDLRGLFRAGLTIAFAVTLFGIVPMCLVNKYLFNSYSVLASRDPYYLTFSHAHPFLLLFSPLGGFFFWTPVAWLSVVGAFFALRDRPQRALAVGMLLACVSVTFIASAVLDWHGSGTFGARRLTVLVPLLSIYATFAIAAIARWMERAPRRTPVALGAAFVTVIALPYVGNMLGHVQQRSWDRATQEGLFGRGVASFWWIMDQRVGDLAVLPFEALYSIRYRVPPTTFHNAVYPWHSKATNVVESVPMFWKLGMPPLEDERVVARGFQRIEVGLEMWEPKAAIIFTAEWPRATELRLTVSSRTPVHLRIGRGKAFGGVSAFGAIDLPGEGRTTTHTLKIPDGEFDSGMNEFVFECDNPIDGHVVLRSLSLDDSTSYSAPYPGSK